LKEYKDALPVYHALFGEDHPEISTLLNNIGRAQLMIGDVDNAEPVLRDALKMTEKFMNGDPLVSPLNSLGMIDAYHGRMAQAQHELELAESTGRGSESPFLDQVLLSEADLYLKKADTATASARLKESKMLLEKGHPEDSDSAWRYAVWDAVNAEFLARTGNSVAAARVLAAAQPIIIQRFGEHSFYNLLAKRRAQLIASTPKH
jgi:hypothetical protein